MVLNYLCKSLGVKELEYFLNFFGVKVEYLTMTFRENQVTETILSTKILFLKILLGGDKMGKWTATGS